MLQLATPHSSSYVGNAKYHTKQRQKHENVESFR